MSKPLIKAQEAIRSHIQACGEDKYAKHQGIFNADYVHGPNAKVINLSSAAKYLTRYESEGFEKSGQTIDLMKAIHHLLMQLENDLNKL